MPDDRFRGVTPSGVVWVPSGWACRVGATHPADLARVDLLERLEQSAASSSQIQMRVGDFER